MHLCNKIRNFFILSIGIIFCVSAIAKAQLQPHFETYQIKDGLPSSTIYNIKFAKNNLLFLGHAKGLSSYDGGYFRNFYNAYQPNTELTNIMEAPNGNIYAKAFNNTIYELINDTLQFVFCVKNKSGFSNSCLIGDDIMSFGDDSVMVFNTINKSIKSVPYPRQIETWPNAKIIHGHWCSTSSIDDLFLILIDENKNLYHIKANGKYELPILHFSNGESFGTKYKSLKELTWINKNKKIQLVNDKDKDAIINYINIVNNEIWINTTKGLYIANYDFEIIKHYNFEQASTTAVVKSKDNNYFISTLENGLIKVPSFNNLQLAKLNIRCNQFAVSPSKAIILDKIFKENGAVENNDVTIQYAQNNNQIWFKRALHQAKSLGYKFSKKPIFENGKMPIIKDFTIIPNAILVGTQGGLFIYSETENYHWIKAFELENDPRYYPFKKLKIFQEYVPTVKYDEINDRIMVNTYTGIFELTKANPTGVQLPDPKNTAVKDIEYWQGQLLLATSENGIVVWDGKQYLYNTKQYPTKGYLKHFYKTKNELWLQGEEAIYSFSNTGNSIYNSSNGIPIENAKNIFVADSLLYINYGNIITAVPKRLNNTNTVNASILIHAIKQGTQSIQPNAALSYNQNDISILFSYITYNGKNNHIAYSINGQNLIHLSNNDRSINIPNLNPDDYTIQLFSVENDIINAKPIQEVRFSISPPFYKTFLFTLLAVVLSLLIAFLIARYILNNYKREALHKEAKLLMEKELDKSMLTSIKAQMNPHFIFNALNTIQSYIYSNDKQNASVYIAKFSDLTRSILEMSNKETVTLDEEIKSLKLYLDLEKMRFEDTLNYEIKVDKNISLESIKIPSMLVQPYIENAIKHGLLHKKTDRKLQLNYMLEGDLLSITIDDNGIGRKRSEELNNIKNKHHQSFAMDANKKRLEILKSNAQDIYLEIIDKMGDKGEAIGTKVVIKLKV